MIVFVRGVFVRVVISFVFGGWIDKLRVGRYRGRASRGPISATDYYSISFYLISDFSYCNYMSLWCLVQLHG